MQRKGLMKSKCLPPISRLLDDILIEIFICTANEQAINIVKRDPGRVWQLQQVCTLWRHLARCTPVLWNKFELPDPRKRDGDINAMLMRVRYCLEFSRTAPLTITFLDDRGHGPLSPALDEVVKNSYRWKSFYTTAAILQTLMDSGERSRTIRELGVPQLRSFSLHGGWDEEPDEDAEDPPEYVLQFFESATALAELTINGGGFLHPSYFPYAKVETLKIDNFLPYEDSFSESYEVGAALSAMKSLKEIKWRYNWHYRYRYECIPRSLSFSSLHTLIVDDCPPLFNILDRFYVPSLTSLRIADPENHMKDISSILTMIRKSKCSVNKLELWLHSASHISKILEALPTVEELSLIGHATSEEVIKKLIWVPKPDHTNVVPSLLRLDVLAKTNYEYFSAFDWDDQDYIEYTDPISFRGIAYLGSVIDSRSLGATWPLTRKPIAPEGSLLYVKCSTYVPDGWNEGWEEVFERLKVVGDQSGCYVEVELFEEPSYTDKGSDDSNEWTDEDDSGDDY